MKTIPDIINYFASICPSEPRKKMWKEKLQKFEYLVNEKSFYD